MKCQASLQPPLLSSTSWFHVNCGDKNAVLFPPTHALWNLDYPCVPCLEDLSVVFWPLPLCVPFSWISESDITTLESSALTQVEGWVLFFLYLWNTLDLSSSQKRWQQVTMMDLCLSPLLYSEFPDNRNYTYLWLFPWSPAHGMGLNTTSCVLAQCL